MYVEHFGLTAEAFCLTPDPAFLYQSPGHAEALAAIKVGLRGRRGLMLMTGEVGTGKTTLLYSLLSDLGPEIHTAYISNTLLSLDDILRQALADFHVSCASSDRVELLAALNSFLQRCAVEGATAALVIDEAHNLDDLAFEHIRLLSNFETFTSKLLQIVLVGQPELDSKLRRRNLRQVAERIAVRCHVNPLSRAESIKYIAHRLRCAGGPIDLFSQSALRAIVRHAQGIPRRINILCHNALLFAYGRDARQVSRAMVRAAVRAREGRGLVRLTERRSTAPSDARRTVASRWLRPAAGIATAAAAGVVAGMQWSDGRTQPRGSDVHPSVVVAEQESATVSPAAPDAPLTGSAGVARAELLIDPARTEPDVDASSLAPSTGESGAPPAQDATSAQQGDRMVHIAHGATLGSLVREVYGEVSPTLLNRVRLANPKIVDPDRILAGDVLRFPSVAGAATLAEGHHE